MKVIVNKNPDGFKRLRTLNESLTLSVNDFSGPVLIMLGQIHRKQTKDIFSSLGRKGAGGAWAPLSDSYAKRKLKKYPRRKMLVLTGDTLSRLTVPSDPRYFQTFSPTSHTAGVFKFGASSSVAAAHLHGDPSLAPNKSDKAKKIFGGIAPRLPVRDMITKTEEQVTEMRRAFIRWYAARVKQVLRSTTAKRGT